MSAVDIVAVRQEDGSIKSTAMYVLFNSIKSCEEVTLEVNGTPIPEVEMMAHQSGEIYFSPKLKKRENKTEKAEIDTQPSKGFEDLLKMENSDEEEMALAEGETKQELENHIFEEEFQIREQVAEENLLLSNKVSASPLVEKFRFFRNNSNNGNNSNGNNTNGNNSNNNSKSSSRSNSKSNSKNASPSSSRTSSPKMERAGLLSFIWTKKDTQTVVLNKIPSKELLKLMNLRDGENLLKFTTVTTKQTATAKLFLLSRDAKIIVSDIDGTITKTDKRGLFYYKLGYDWTHDRVVDLYKKLADNGYFFVYLTARSMKVQTATKTYLEKIGVPHGPVLCAPHDLFSCVTTEFWKTTAEGKLSHLNPLRELFPDEYNPLVAGFGNRLHDHLCYKTIGIPQERIYIINRASEVMVDGQKTNYETLMQICPLLFPPVPITGKGAEETSTFSSSCCTSVSNVSDDLESLRRELQATK